MPSVVGPQGETGDSVRTMKEIFTVCPRNCFGSCRLKVQTQDGRLLKVLPGGFPAGEVLCRRAARFPDYVHNPRRLQRPMIRSGRRGDGEFRPCSWDDILRVVQEKLSGLKASFGAQSILMLEGSGNMGVARHSQWHFWEAFGGCSLAYGDLCDPAAQEVIRLSLGSVKMNATKEVANAPLIVNWGKNPVFTHPQIMPYVVKALGNGAKLVTIDPRRNESSRGSDLFLQPFPGTDGDLALGLCRLVLDRNLEDEGFLRQHVHDAEDFVELIKKNVSLDQVAERTGVSVFDMEKFCALLKETREVALLCGSGLQRYPNGGRTILYILSLAVLLGLIGRKNRGFYYNDKQSPELLWPFPVSLNERNFPKTVHVGSIGKDLQRKGSWVRAMWITRSNPMVSHPDRNALEKAFSQLDFIVVSDLYPTETVKWADIVLPAASFVEYDDLIRGYGHPYIQYQPRILNPLGESLSDLDLTRRLMEAFGFDPGPLSLSDKDILQKVLDVSGIPRLIDDLLREPYLFPEYDEIAFSDGAFETPSGKIELFSRDLPNIFETGPDETGGKGFPWTLLSSHSDKSINSQFSFTPGLKIAPVLSVNEEEAKDAGLEDGDTVEVWNERGAIRCTVKKTDSIRLGVLHLFFGAWDVETGSTINRLTAGGMTDIGWGTAFHNCGVSLRRLP